MKRAGWLVAVLAQCLAGCAQSPPAVTPAPSQSVQAPGSAPLSRATHGTIYVTNIFSNAQNELIGYSLRTFQMTYFTDDPSLRMPEGIGSDRSGAIYVANTYGYNILKFEPPRLKPTKRIDDKGYRPSDVAVDSKGNIWVANWCTKSASCGPGNVREYDSAGKLLQTIKCSNLERPIYLAIDRNDDLVIDGDTFKPPQGAAEIAAGATSCTPLTAIQIGAPGGVAFTKNGDVTVTDDLYAIMYTYAKPDFSRLIQTTHFYGIASANETVFAPGDDYVWVDSGSSTGIYEFPYPSGGYPINYYYGSLYFPTGVTITRK